MYFISKWLAAALKTEKAVDSVTFSLSPDNEDPYLSSKQDNW